MSSKNGKIIAVWGNEDCGKTTTACQLALALAEKNKDVILVHTDIITPVIPVLMPSLKEQNTMGMLWSDPECSWEAVLKSCVVTKSKHLCLLGYKAMENVFSYPDYVKENVFNVYTELKNLADYVVIDCVSYFAYNMLTAVALEIADKVVRLGEATLKSFSFFDSNLSMLTDRRYDVDEHIRVLSKTKSFQPRELAAGRLSAHQHELPYDEGIERMMLEGTLLDKRTGSTYGKQLDKLLGVLMGDELNE